MNVSPTLAQFLTASLEEIARFAPASMVYSPGGTRRKAAMLGIAAGSQDYFHWARQATLQCADTIFRCGVRHLFTGTLVPSNFQELTAYHHQLLDWVKWGVAGEEAVADYQRYGWRVRLVGAEQVPALQESAHKLIEATPAQAHHTLWWTVVLNDDAPWQSLFSANHQTQPPTRQQAIQTLYGEQIPLITLYLGFGKPLVSFNMLPPLLAGNLQCYWLQQPGYDLTEQQFRTILYDYAHLRQTWREDKTGRAEQALEYRQVWEQDVIIGLGQRVGPHWYPVLPALPPH